MKRGEHAWRASLVLVLAAVGCGDRHGVAAFDIASADDTWFDGASVRLEPAIRMPSASAELQQVEVWMRLAAGSTVGIATGDDGRARLHFGAGTRADRIEWTGSDDARRIVDVRGTWIDDAGRCTHHVLRPVEERVGAPLAGEQWPCDDAQAERVATARMQSRIAELPPLRAMADEQVSRALARFAEQNQCDGCHREGRGDATRVDELGVVWRGTDANGFFVPASILRDALPLEGYGAFDRNVEDPAITVDCGDVEAVAIEPRHGVKRWRCADDRVPIGRFDWSIARARDPARAQEICHSRRRLWDHLDEAARALYPDALAPC